MYKAFIVSLFVTTSLNSQVLLNADGATDTYNLINSVLAPGYTAVEVPDCGHEEFGYHITQVYDDVLDTYVFQFHIHRDEDSDRCINYDRQRTEIKSYAQSPDNLKAIEGEVVRYMWKFKIDKDFQPSSSFTHLHQLKAVGGSEESMPLITLTARKSNPDKLELRYAKNMDQITIKEVDLNPFRGIWVEATETVLYGESGAYNLVIKTVVEQDTLLNYSSAELRTWKTNAEFIRPKWGIYRSLNDYESLRDEIVCFANFSIEEIEYTSITPPKNNDIEIYPNPTGSGFIISNITGESITVLQLNGVICFNKNNVREKELILNHLGKGVYIVTCRSSGNYCSNKVFIY